MTGSGGGWAPSVVFGPEDRSQPAGRVFAILLDAQLDRFRELEPSVRAGEDLGALHDYRVVLRRARSLLDAGRSVYPAEECELLHALLAELTAVTASVRDLDVLGEVLPERLARLAPVLRPGGDTLCVELAGRRDRAQARLVEWMDSDAHASLLRRWQLLASVHRIGGSEPGPDALAPAGLVADGAVATAYERVVAGGADLVASSDPEDWHRLRKRLKRLRYIVTAVSPLYPPERFDVLLRELSELQDRFGDLQDDIVHGQLVVRAGLDLGGEAALAAGALADRLSRRADKDLRRCRDRYPRLERRAIRRSIPD